MAITISGTTGIAGVDGSAGTPAVQGTDTNTGVFYPAADTVGVSTGGSERMRVDSSGNVGIGYTSMSQKLQVNGNIALAASTGLLWDTSGSWQISSDDSTYIRFVTSGSEKMRIDSSGNVGIGTSAPRASKLDVLSATGTQNTSADNPGLVNITGPNGANGSQPILVLATNDAMAGNIGPAITFQARYVTSSTAAATFAYIQGIKENATSGNLQGALLFVTRNSAGNFPEAMRIDSSGNLLVGYTTSNGAYKLQVNSQIFATSATIATSDGRYKKDIQSLDGALKLVNQLNPVQFSWKQHPVHDFDTSTPTIGFIAQEVQQVLADKPYLNSIIKANECVIQPEEKDADGNVTKQAVTEEFLGIAEGNMIALLTKAIQEQQALITALTARIEALEAK